MAFGGKSENGVEREKNDRSLELDGGCPGIGEAIDPSGSRFRCANDVMERQNRKRAAEKKKTSMTTLGGRIVKM